MSNVLARTYSYPVVATLSQTVDDPAGPFTGLQVGSTGGTLVIWPLNGPQTGLPLTLNVIAGQELHFPVRRVGSASTATGIIGLVDAAHRGMG
jgi:hypothetical protein